MRKQSKKWAQAKTGYLFLAFPLVIFGIFTIFPMVFPLVIFGIFTIFPMVFAFMISLYDWNLLIPDKPFIGLGNYVELFQDEVFLIAIKNTIIYALGVVPVQTILSLFLAFIMNQNLHMLLLDHLLRFHYLQNGHLGFLILLPFQVAQE